MTPRTECRPSLHTRVPGDIPQLGGIQHVDDRKGDNGRGVTRQLKRIGNVIGKMSAGPVHSPSHADMLNKRAGIVQSMAGKKQCGGCPSRLPATRPRLY